MFRMLNTAVTTRRLLQTKLPSTSLRLFSTYKSRTLWSGYFTEYSLSAHEMRSNCITLKNKLSEVQQLIKTLYNPNKSFSALSNKFDKVIFSKEWSGSLSNAESHINEKNFHKALNCYNDARVKLESQLVEARYLLTRLANGHQQLTPELREKIKLHTSEQRDYRLEEDNKFLHQLKNQLIEIKYIPEYTKKFPEELRILEFTILYLEKTKGDASQLYLNLAKLKLEELDIDNKIKKFRETSTPTLRR
jgi:hypothetical protein